MSKDLLKEAIADAKAVRETAIANAKLALEEAFTPKLQSMLSAKLQEDDIEDEEEVDVDAVEAAHGDEEAEEGHHEAAHDEDEAEAEEGMREEDDEDHEAEEGMREEDEEEGDDLDLEEIIKELEGEEEDEAEEGMREQSDSSDVGKGDNKMDQANNDTEDPGKGKLSEEAEEDEEIDLDEVIKSLTEEDEDDEEVTEEDDKEAELEEAYNTIRSLKDTLQEVNLLNAKLLFSNKLFKGNNLSESQKMKVIETFDRASNLREVKLVYTTLAESFTGKTVKKGLTEGFASKKSNSTAPKGQIVESNGMADRMKRLAGLL